MKNIIMTFLLFIPILFNIGCQKTKTADNQGITSLTCELDRPNSICVDGSYIYWLGTDFVGKIPKNGGTPIKLTNIHLGDRYILTMDDSYLYWLDGDYWQNGSFILRVPKGGGLVDTILNIDFEVFDMCTDMNAIYLNSSDYFLTWSGVVKIPKNNRQDFLLGDVGPNINGGGEVIVDGDYVYWYNMTAGKIFRVSIYGGVTESFINRIDGPFTLDADYLYWINENTLYRLAKTEGSSQPLGTVSAQSIQIDQTYIYLLSPGLKNAAEGIIKKIPKVGGSITTLYSGLQEPTSFIIDNNYLYWGDMKRSTHGNDCIKKAPK